jgi:hypothetical protein
MTDLLDIAPSTAAALVTIGDKRVKVRGIGVDAIASIVSRYPGLRVVLGGGDGTDRVAQLITGCGAAAGAIIAAGCGHPGDPVYEQHAGRLLPEYQLAFLKEIVGLTFPNGIRSFLDKFQEAERGDERKPVRVRLKPSPSQLPQSSASDSRLTMQ